MLGRLLGVAHLGTPLQEEKSDSSVLCTLLTYLPSVLATISRSDSVVLLNTLRYAGGSISTKSFGMANFVVVVYL